MMKRAGLKLARIDSGGVGGCGGQTVRRRDTEKGARWKVANGGCDGVEKAKRWRQKCGHLNVCCEHLRVLFQERLKQPPFTLHPSDPSPAGLVEPWAETTVNLFGGAFSGVTWMWAASSGRLLQPSCPERCRWQVEGNTSPFDSFKCFTSSRVFSPCKSLMGGAFYLVRWVSALKWCYFCHPLSL